MSVFILVSYFINKNWNAASLPSSHIY